MRKFIWINLLVWIFPIALFWLFKGVINPILYSIIFLHGWYNIFALLISFLIGKRDYFGRFKWIVPFVIGVMNAATHPATFGLANTIVSGNINLIDIRDVINHTILSIIGLLLGVFAHYLCNRRTVK